MLLACAAIGGPSFVPGCGPKGLADYAAAFSTYSLNAMGVHQIIADTAAERIREGGCAFGKSAAAGGGGGGDAGDGLGAGAWTGGGPEPPGRRFDARQLERLVRALAVRRGDVDLARLLGAVQVGGARGGQEGGLAPGWRMMRSLRMQR